MKNKECILGCAMALSLVLSACGTPAATGGITETTSPSDIASEETVTEAVSEGEAETMETNQDAGIAEAIAQETSEVDLTAGTATGEEERIPTAEISDKYIDLRVTECGSIEHISYETKDYYGDGAVITKEANVYLPAGYSEDKQYNVLYLMHGIGGDETEWGMTGSSSRVKSIMDNLTYYGDIVVTPNGRSSADNGKNAKDYNSFYCFGRELRNDLIPYMDSHYSTYADFDENGYDLTAARDHRAMAGLSMGGMQTINIGICECVDVLSYFGAFSAAPTSNAASKIAQILKDNEYPIHYFYNICGTSDNIAYASASAAAKTLPAQCDQLVDGENYMWQEVSGGHDFNVWYLGFYNFAQLAFSKTE